LDGHTPSAICGWDSVGSGGPFLRQALAPSYLRKSTASSKRAISSSSPLPIDRETAVLSLSDFMGKRATH